MLLLLVLGLVVVVPKLACLACPRLKPAVIVGEVGLPGVTDADEDGEWEKPGDGDDGMLPLERAASRPSATPLGLTGDAGVWKSSAGVDG